MKRRPLIIVFSILLFAGLVFGGERFFSRTATDVTVSRVTISPAEVDFGDIAQDGGMVSTTVMVKNEGGQPLEINRISTSCGCTTAEMDMSPLEPGLSRPLTISFDPMAHPDQSGPITRAVYLQTSDPEQPEVEIEVIGNVISSN